MGEFVPQLVDEGKQPRVMLEYSGILLHGLRQMGLTEVFRNLSMDAVQAAKSGHHGTPMALAPLVYTGRIVGMHAFGASAPLKELQKNFGFAPDRVASIAKELLRRK